MVLSSHIARSNRWLLALSAFSRLRKDTGLEPSRDNDLVRQSVSFVIQDLRYAQHVHLTTVTEAAASSDEKDKHPMQSMFTQIKAEGGGPMICVAAIQSHRR